MRGLLADWHSWGVGDWAIAVVILAALIALVCVAIRQFGLTIPAWVAQVFWIVVCAVVVIFAIELVLSL